MKRILIVDDEESIRVALSALIGRLGFRVESASNGAAALERLASDDFDIAFVDVRMPDMDGIAVARAIIEQELPVTVIVMSAYGSIDNAREALQAGAYDYITKPFKPDEVSMVLAKAEEREALRRENARLKREMASSSSFCGIVSQSPLMKDMFALIDKIARVNSTVLIHGESGTGKELVARAIHMRSPRSPRSFVAVNCGAIPETLIESELFGYRKGAFTDANADKPGLFLEADGGTLLLDEIGELPGALQVKLLRVLQEGTIRRVGDTQDTAVDVRIIAATLQNLDDLVAEGTFREDLYYRLNVVPLRVPPLRERPEDIPLLLSHFIAHHGARMESRVRYTAPAAERAMMLYSWPGNVRELENAVERALVLAEGDTISLGDLPERIAESRDEVKRTLATGELSIKKTMRVIEEELIRRALVAANGNRTAASRMLEISHRALLYKMKDYGIR